MDVRSVVRGAGPENFRGAKFAASRFEGGKVWMRGADSPAVDAVDIEPNARIMARIGIVGAAADFRDGERKLLRQSNHSTKQFLAEHDGATWSGTVATATRASAGRCIGNILTRVRLILDAGGMDGGELDARAVQDRGCK